ncbi:MAG: SH3 domain-containing protein [Candidatus Glassbacteria bacterium]|nr:SH3 domain-containing protein [Candidatus Glassbacteria bacterium]
MITNRYANIRSGPGTKFRRIGRAMKGERFPVAEVRPKWYRITYRQQAGWVYAELCRLEQVSSQEVESLVDEVQVLGRRVDQVMDKLDEASSRMTRLAEEKAAAESGRPGTARGKAVMRPPVHAAWALVPGGARLVSGQKLSGTAMLAATGGCLALGLYYHSQYSGYMTDYRELPRSAQPGEFNRLYDKAQSSLKLSDGLLYTTAGLYLLNIVDHYFILPRTGSSLRVEVDKPDRTPESGERIHLSLSRPF